MSTTRSITMANPRPEDGENSLWQGYDIQSSNPSAASHPPAFEPSYHQSPALALPYHGGPQKGSYRSLDLPSMQQRPPTRESTGVLTASPPTLNSHHSFPSLKRGFDGLPYGENVHDFREDVAEMPKPTINQDHRLLSFGRLQDKHTILDSQGRVHQIELAAQIHGMFFLSELATPASESLMVQPELTCYRRNLFQISGSVTCPRGPLSVMADGVHRIPIVSMEVVISATESVDGHIVKLIVIPWKTPPPNSPEIPSGQEHEPSPIPLVPFDEGPEANSEFTVYPIAYRRLQFRIATANNGRRRELQQHFTLHLNVVGNLANGTKVNVCETATSPIVVRGRSPRNFQARKEIPLVGSSSSRGQPPELHLATNMMQNNSMDAKGKMGKPPGMLELQRSPFTFDSSSIAGSPSLIRQSNYQAWNTQQTPGHTASPNTPNYSAPLGQLDSYLQINHSNPDLNASTTATMPPLGRPQYGYGPSSAPPAPPSDALRFIDNNPRPAKSPRHIAPPAVPSNAPYTMYGGTPYTSPNDILPSRAPDYFPQNVNMPPQTWTTAPDTGVVYGTTAQGPSLQAVQHYEFPGDSTGYVKGEGGSGQQPHYTWNPA